MTSPVLSVRDLTVTFRTREGPAKVVDKVSYDLGQGETLAIVGESGSGKSVSSLALMQLLPTPPAVVEGEAIFEGRNLLAQSEEHTSELQSRADLVCR